MEPVQRVRRLAWRRGLWGEGERTVPEEAAIALSYNRMTQAVMMATPADLEDFAIGFSLSEGIVSSVAEIVGLDVVPVPHGIDLRMDITPEAATLLLKRRRVMAGPTGCGLCGIESLEQAMRAPAKVEQEATFSPEAVTAALSSLAEHQALHRETSAVHAAAYWQADRGLVALREDVGRHNALDKLAGALARSSIRAARGIVVVTSRISIEMVQKASVIGAPVLVGISAPTALALRAAEEAGIALIGIARGDGFELFTHSERIEAVEHVA